MSLEKLSLIVIVVAVLFYGRLYFKGVFYTVDELAFRQAGVKIDFRQKTITIKGRTFGVGQVTGIRMEAFTSSRRHGDSATKTVTIALDDFSKPQHKVLFISKGHAQRFMQRLATALRKAGGPDFA